MTTSLYKLGLTPKLVEEADIEGQGASVSDCG